MMLSKIRAERRWLEQHPGQAFDEALLDLFPALDDVMLQPAERFNAVARDRIVRLEQSVAKLPQYECPIKHYFVDGLYVREIEIPAGCILVGYIHMQPCITTLSKGVILISEGEKTVRIEAPFTTTVAPGSKKAGYALTDCIWSDAYVNPDNERDIDKLEARLTANTHAEYLTRRNEMLRLERK